VSARGRRCGTDCARWVLTHPAPPSRPAPRFTFAGLGFAQKQVSGCQPHWTVAIKLSPPTNVPYARPHVPVAMWHCLGVTTVRLPCNPPSLTPIFSDPSHVRRTRQGAGEPHDQGERQRSIGRAETNLCLPRSRYPGPLWPGAADHTSARKRSAVAHYQSLCCCCWAGRHCEP
jgi:hypothetical protein